MRNLDTPPTPKRPLTLTCRVDNYRSGWPIVEFLAHRFKYHAADAWATRVRDGLVTINTEVARPEHTVARDDLIGYTIFHTEPDVDYRYSVLFEDDHYLAVSKSGNIPVHACGIFITNTLITRLRTDYGDRVTLCHRLDRETSGVVVLAKHKEANRELAGMFARGEVDKEYVAVVFGRMYAPAGASSGGLEFAVRTAVVPQTAAPTPAAPERVTWTSANEFTISAPIGKIDIRYQYPAEYAHGKARDMATYLPKVAVDYRSGKPSRTRGRVTYATDTFTVLRIFPDEGRTNQIRVHLAHAGHPVLGDKTYALSGLVRDEQLRDGLTPVVRAALVMDRHALHCECLSFTHPMTGAPLDIHAPVPEDLGNQIAAAG